MEIIWTQNALNDMQNIREYLKVNESPSLSDFLCEAGS
jgi:plasmid stabilization system protein ParE